MRRRAPPVLCSRTARRRAALPALPSCRLRRDRTPAADRWPTARHTVLLQKAKWFQVRRSAAVLDTLAAAKSPALLSRTRALLCRTSVVARGTASCSVRVAQGWEIPRVARQPAQSAMTVRAIALNTVQADIA